MTTFDLLKTETIQKVSGSDDFAKCVEELSKFQFMVPQMEVKDAASKALASETLIQIKQTEEDLENLRKSAKAPYLEMGKTIDSVFKPLVTACQNTRQMLAGKLLIYNKEETAEAERRQKEAMKQEVEAKEAGKDAPLKPPGEYPMFYPGIEKTDSGKTFTRKRTKFEVVDEVKLLKSALDKRNKIPLKVATVNEAALREAVNAKLYSERNWAKYGVRVYEIDEIVTRGE